MADYTLLLYMSSNILTTTYQSPCGEIILGAFNGSLCLCDWKQRKARNAIDRRIQHFFKADYCEGPSSVTEAAKHELDKYFRGETTQFHTPVSFAGTEFQQKVWRGLQSIPYGESMSYLQFSQMLGIPKSVRAVANANGANAISIFVPCHRIIGSNSQLTGYAGGLEAKRFLLDLEQSKNCFSVPYK